MATQVNKNKTAVTSEQRLDDINAMVKNFADVWKSASGSAPNKLNLESYELKATNAYDKSHRVKGTRQMTEKQSEIRGKSSDSLVGVKGFTPNTNTGQKKLGTQLDNGIDYEVHIVFKRLDKADKVIA